ncbi:inositol monophosphatase family protein [Goodfellowiella coeruleoviolacea]|uniref:inositol-phosphate phosphatase n=1 Tax=Goodfellowiella coeruleoviolacea TaxID=334858 RepID=A0AAE3GGX8_9PSEU|nr:inositol monophosphatase [Goodfellowiella coeruleoviolacea]MCP2165928.1 myo-inositol-1(or 4)-monophosphatase [Goodfellowiella coeruleoviolacea]
MTPALSSRTVRPAPPGLLSLALEVAGRLANDAADVITATAGRGGKPDTGDSPFDWVTDTARTLELHTRRVLVSEFPGIPVVCENARFPDTAFEPSPAGQPVGPGAEPESESESAAAYRWLVDPVDGTTNYVAGMPWCAYSLALVDQWGPVVGVVADPYRAQIYAAARGRGMRANGTPVRLTDRGTADGAIVCTELGRSGSWPGLGTFIGTAAGARTTVRVLGSAALSVAQVALGHAVAAVLHDYREWDVAGALALAAESGAVVLDRSGHPAPLPVDGLLVAAPSAARDVLDWWRSATG